MEINITNELLKSIKKLNKEKIQHRKLSDIAISLPKKTLTKGKLIENGKYPVINSGREIYGFYNKYNNSGNAVTLASRGEYAGDVNYFKDEFWAGGLSYPYRSKDEKFLKTKFLYYVLKNKEKYIMDNLVVKTGIPALNKGVLENIEIPIPPLEVQEKIAEVLDSFSESTEELQENLNKELNLRKKQYEYYRDKLLNNEDFPIYKLNKIGKVCMCKRIMKAQTIEKEKLNQEIINKVVPFYKIGTFGKEADSYIPKSLYNEYKSKYSYPKKGDILISCSGTIGRTVVFDGEPAYFQDSNIVWIKNDEKIVLNKYLYFLYQLKPFEITQGGTIARLYNSGIENAEVRIPLIEQQERILEILEPLEQLTQSLTEGISEEMKRRKKQHEYYRNLLLDF